MKDFIRQNRGRLSRNILFWLFYISMYLVLNKEKTGPFVLTHVLVEFLAFGLPAYLHSLYLFPNFMIKRRLSQYISITLLLLASLWFWPSFLFDTYYAIFPNAIPSDPERIGSTVQYFMEGLFFIILFTLSSQTFRSFQLRRQLVLLEKEKLQTELDNLRTQINPHFLFNALNTIYGLSRTDPNRSSDSILQLSDILRYVIYECNTPHVPLAKELRFVEKVIGFATTRGGEHIEVKTEIINEDKVGLIPPMLLIPLIENCFKHASAPQGKTPWIELYIRIKQGVLDAEFQNSNYLSEMTHNSDKPNSGVGLANVKRRLDFLQENEPQLIIQDKKDVFKVALQLKLT